MADHHFLEIELETDWQWHLLRWIMVAWATLYILALFATGTV